MTKYTVKELADSAGISVRTLHHYDHIGLLRPALRTEGRYRIYGQSECLRLQQILFYRELDFSLQEIIGFLNEPGWDLMNSLKQHREALVRKQERLNVLLGNIDLTIKKLNNKEMITKEEVYEGFKDDDGLRLREEAVEKWGTTEVERSEAYLTKLSKPEFNELKDEQRRIFKRLFELLSEDPKSEKVQMVISQHFTNTMTFWGKRLPGKEDVKAYRGLGELYISDERYTMVDGIAQPEFANFLREAMGEFVRKRR